MQNSPRRHRPGVDADWPRLTVDPSALATAATWNLTPSPPSSLDEVLTAVGFEMPPTRSNESRFVRLVRLAADDPLAARVALQRILPGLCAKARPLPGHAGDPVTELLAAAWIAIRTYGTNRHPGFLAPALISDACVAVYRRGRSRVYRVDPVDPAVGFGSRIEETAQRTALEEVVDLVEQARRAGAIDDDDVAFVGQLVRHKRAVDVAAALGITPRTVRNRSRRLADALRLVA